MTRRIPGYFNAPDADIRDEIDAFEYDAGALHELVHNGEESRYLITKIVRKPRVVTVLDSLGAPTGTRVEFSQSFAEIPQVYDRETDLVYVWQLFSDRNFVPCRKTIMAIDPRSKTIVRERDIWVRTSDDTSPNYYNYTGRLWLGNGELHLESIDIPGQPATIYTIDINTFVDVCNYTIVASGDVFVPAGPTNDKYFKYTYDTTGVRIQIYTRTLSGQTPTFTLTKTSPLLVIKTDAISGAGADVVADVYDGYLWAVSRGFIDDTNLVGKEGNIVAWYKPSDDSIGYGQKPQPPVSYGNGANVTGIYFAPCKKLSEYAYPKTNGTSGIVITTTRNDGEVYDHIKYVWLARFFNPIMITSKFGGLRDTSNGAFSDRPGAMKLNSRGIGYVTDFWDDSAIYEYNATQTHRKYDRYQFAMGTSHYGNQSYLTGQGTYSSPITSAIRWSGQNYNHSKGQYSGSMIPPKNHGFSGFYGTPTYNRTPPSATALPLPTGVGEGVITADLLYPRITDGTSTFAEPIWHKLTHDGTTTKLLTFLSPDDATADTNQALQYVIYAALYTPDGKLLQRFMGSPAHFHQTGYTRADQDNETYQYGFVLRSDLPAGDYYIGVLPYMGGDYNGRTLFCDYEFDGYSDSLADGTPNGYKYKIRVQMHEAEPAPPPHVCEYPTYRVYPWIEHLPDYYTDPNHRDAYDLYDGSTFNVYLGGFRDSWISTGANQVYTQIGPSTFGDSTVRVDGGVWYAPSDELDLWATSDYFFLTDPATKARYLAMGGSADGSVNIPPGLNSYPGVASYSRWSNTYFQAKNCSAPISAELWYTLNPARSNPLVGFNGYSFFGDTGADGMPEVYVPSGYVKQYYAGIFKIDADVSNPKDSDCVMVAWYEGGAAGGVMRLLLNGTEIARKPIDHPATDVYGNYDAIFGDDRLGIGSSTNNINYLEINADSDYIYTEPVWPTDGPFGAGDGLINTKNVKFAFYVDSTTGSAPGVWDGTSYISWIPGMFYTIPKTPLPCAPTNIPTYTPPPVMTQINNPPDFLEKFDGAGGVDTRLPNIAPESMRWRENYLGSGQMSAGNYVPNFNDYQELYTESVDNMATVKKVRVIEIKVELPKYNDGATDYRQFEFLTRDTFKDGYTIPGSADFLLKEIGVKIQGNQPQQAFPYTEIKLEIWGVTRNDLFTWTNFGTSFIDPNNWVLPASGFLTIRLEIGETRQSLFINGTQYVTTTVNLADQTLDVNYFDTTFFGGQVPSSADVSKIDYIMMDHRQGYTLPAALEADIM